MWFLRFWVATTSSSAGRGADDWSQNIFTSFILFTLLLNNVCCYLLVTFKVKESTIYFKGYRIFSLLNRGGYFKKLLTLTEGELRREAHRCWVRLVPWKYSSSGFLSTKEFFNLDYTWGTSACMSHIDSHYQGSEMWKAISHCKQRRIIGNQTASQSDIR